LGFFNFKILLSPFDDLSSVYIFAFHIDNLKLTLENITMAEEKKEKWLNYLAISTVLIAVCATLSTFKGSGYSNKALMSQTKASDQWAFYQAKSMKGYMFQMQKDNFELESEMVSKSKGSEDIRTKFQSKMDEYDKKIKQYEIEKEQISNEAKKFEAEKDLFKLHSSAFGIAVIFLQISILLSSISMLAKKRMVWYLSLAVGIIGVFYFCNGFFLFIG
jgi:hypothetical protein